MKISIIYYSETGNTEQVANWIAEGSRSVPEAEVKLFNLRDQDHPDHGEFVGGIHTYSSSLAMTPMSSPS